MKALVEITLELVTLVRLVAYKYHVVYIDENSKKNTHLEKV